MKEFLRIVFGLLVASGAVYALGSAGKNIAQLILTF